VVQDEAHERDHIREDVESDLELWVVHVHDVVDALVDGLDGAQEVGAEDNSVEVDVLLASLNVVEQHSGLVQVVHSLFLSDVREPQLEARILSHSPLKHFLSSRLRVAWLLFFLFFFCSSCLSSCSVRSRRTCFDCCLLLFFILGQNGLRADPHE